MGPNRITRGGATPPALASIAVALVLAAVLAGCGSGSSSTGDPAELAATGSPEESADAGILNIVLARQEAAIEAYTAAIPHLTGENARIASYFRTQEGEHVDGLLEAMRGSARIPAEPKPETIDPGTRKTETGWLVFLYEVESVTIEREINAIAGLEGGLPRSVLASTVADQAQHLVLLRGALGAAPLAQVPEAFESGTAEAPR